jgi:hypothetical protein
MAFINIKTEWERGIYSVRSIPTKRPVGLNDISTDDRPSNFISSINDVATGNLKYNNEKIYPAMTEWGYLEENLELEYNKGESRAYISKPDKDYSKTIFNRMDMVGDFLDKSTRDLWWMGEYLTGNVTEGFWGESGPGWFLLNQQFLQTFNARVNTKIYNPLSLFRVPGLSSKYQFPPFVDLHTDFPFGNKQYTKWMENKINNESNFEIQQPSPFQKFINDATDLFGIPNDNKTIFERYKGNSSLGSNLVLTFENNGDVSSLSDNNELFQVFSNKKSFINTWNVENKFPKEVTKIEGDGSPYLLRNGDDITIQRPFAKNIFGSRLTDWVENESRPVNPDTIFKNYSEGWPKLSNYEKRWGDLEVSTISDVVSGSNDETYKENWPKVEIKNLNDTQRSSIDDIVSDNGDFSFTEGWPDSTNVTRNEDPVISNVNNYFTYNYNQIRGVARGDLKKFSDTNYTRPEGSENMKSIPTKENVVNYGYSKYVKNFDWRRGNVGALDTSDNISWNDIVDRVNMIDYGKDYPDNVRDIVPFKIYDIYNKKWIIFRSFVTGITDNPTSEWSEKSYIGRQDKVYIYTGASREFNFSLKIMAFSLAEMKPLYKKLNYLIGLQYPHMKENDANPKMIAPFVKLTIGSILKDTYGYFSSINLTYSDEIPWELGDYNDTENGADEFDNVKLPMGCDITFTFKVVADELLHSKSKQIFGLPDSWIIMEET